MRHTWHHIKYMLLFSIFADTALDILRFPLEHALWERLWS